MNDRKECILPIFIQPRVSFTSFHKNKTKNKGESSDQRKMRLHIEWRGAWDRSRIHRSPTGELKPV
jgi:hypothetical protein